MNLNTRTTFKTKMADSTGATLMINELPKMIKVNDQIKTILIKIRKNWKIRMKKYIQENDQKKTQNTRYNKITKKTKLIAKIMLNSSMMRALSSGSDLN